MSQAKKAEPSFVNIVRHVSTYLPDTAHQRTCTPPARSQRGECHTDERTRVTRSTTDLRFQQALTGRRSCLHTALGPCFLGLMTGISMFLRQNSLK